MTPRVLRDPETGDMLIEREGIIVARVPGIVESKWPGISARMAMATLPTVNGVQEIGG